MFNIARNQFKNITLKHNIFKNAKYSTKFNEVKQVLNTYKKNINDINYLVNHEKLIICCTFIGGGCGVFSSFINNSNKQPIVDQIFNGIYNGFGGALIGALCGLSSPIIIPLTIFTGTLYIVYTGYLYIYPPKNEN